MVVSSPQLDSQGEARVGFVASKKVGNAPERNRAKRRLRAAAQGVSFEIDRDYVIVATPRVVSCDFGELVSWIQDCTRQRDK